MASSSNKKAAKARSRAQARAQSKRRPVTGARGRANRPPAESERARRADVASMDASRSMRAPQAIDMARTSRPSLVARVTVGLILLALVVSMFSMLAVSAEQW